MKITGEGAAETKRTDERNQQLTLQNCTPLTNCISKVNNTQVDNAKDFDFLMPMYDLI